MWIRAMHRLYVCEQTYCLNEDQSSRAGGWLWCCVWGMQKTCYVNGGRVLLIMAFEIILPIFDPITYRGLTNNDNLFVATT